MLGRTNTYVPSRNDLAVSWRGVGVYGANTIEVQIDNLTFYASGSANAVAVGVRNQSTGSLTAHATYNEFYGTSTNRTYTKSISVTTSGTNIDTGIHSNSICALDLLLQVVSTGCVYHVLLMEYQSSGVLFVEKMADANAKPPPHMDMFTDIKYGKSVVFPSNSSGTWDIDGAISLTTADSSGTQLSAYMPSGSTNYFKVGYLQYGTSETTASSSGTLSNTSTVLLPNNSTTNGAMGHVWLVDTTRKRAYEIRANVRNGYSGMFWCRQLL